MQPALLFLRIEVAPAAILESSARRAHCTVNLQRATGGALRERRAGGGVEDRERLAGRGRNDLAVNQMTKAAAAEKRPSCGA